MVSNSTKALLHLGACFGLTMGCLAVLDGAAFAQTNAAATNNAPQPQANADAVTEGRDVGVMDRQRPEYDAKGIPVDGGFRFFPKLDVLGSYDDNVYDLATKQSDFIVSEVGTFHLASEWGRHFLEGYAGFNNYNYATYDALNLTDWNVGADGRYDVERDSALSGNGSYGEYHEPLYSPNTVGNQASPNRYYKAHTDEQATYGFNRFSLGSGFSYDHYTFDNASLIGGGTIDNSDRNESEYQGYVRSGYVFSPGYTGFLKASYDDRTYDRYLDRNGIHRNSTGYHFDGGVDLQITNLVSGEIYAGYLEQHFDKYQVATLPNVSGMDFGGQLDWYADPVITVHLTGSHQLSDVTLAGVSVSNDETVRLAADWELQYNLIVQGYVNYTHSHLMGSAREDQYPAAAIGATYYFDQHFSAFAQYRYGERISNTPLAGFNENNISIGITGHI